MRALSTCLLLDAGKRCLYVSVYQLKTSHDICTIYIYLYFLSKSLAFTALLSQLLCVSMDWEKDSVFTPQQTGEMNSSLMLLCRLHVRPYLPLNTWSQINIFQISDTISRTHVKLSWPPHLGAICILLNFFCDSPQTNTHFGL